MGIILLLITTIFWGGGFVAQLLGAKHLGPATVIVFRSILAVLFLLGVQVVRRRVKFKRQELIGGMIAGVALFVPMYAQQYAFEVGVKPGVCAFLTANYIMLVPVFGVFVGRRSSPLEWAALLPALLGTYFISVTPNETFHIGLGEFWTLVCAGLFAIEILVVDRFAPGSDAIAFSIITFGLSGICALPFMLLSPEAALVTPTNLLAALPAICFLGLGSSGIGYTFQNLAQSLGTAPTPAAIVMSLESVFGAFFGWLICQEHLSPRAIIGCVLVLFAVFIVALAPLVLKGKPR